MALPFDLPASYPRSVRHSPAARADLPAVTKMATPRMRRINEVLREVIGAAIAELSDPRIGFVTVTSVETSPDLRAAKVHVSVLGSEQEREETMAGLASSHGVLQSKIAAETRMKHTPTL